MFKENLYSHRARFFLSEYIFAFEFCRVVIEQFVLINWFRCGTGTV